MSTGIRRDWLLNVVALVFASLTLVLMTLPSRAAAQDDEPDNPEDTFASIAYSTSTGQYGFAYGKPTAEEAEETALGFAEAEDAEVIVTVKNAWCALALGDDQEAYGYGFGDTMEDARRNAFKEAKKRTTGVFIAVCIASDMTEDPASDDE